MFNNKGESQMDTLDKLIISAKILALVELKAKIQKEIEDLEATKEDTDEIPF
jgi:hypothetical protein